MISCNGVQHIDENGNVCVFNKCHKCKKIIFNLEDNNIKEEINEIGYPRSIILKNIKIYLVKYLHNIEGNSLEDIQINSELNFLDFLMFDYCKNFMNDNQTIKECIKKLLISLHKNGYNESIKYFQKIFNESLI